jgi:precorrin-6B methylase 2
MSRWMPHLPAAAALAAALAVLAAPPLARGDETATPSIPAREPDVVYVPTPDSVVKAMMEMAGVKEGDVVYDLGCGDGRIVVAAAKRGARKAVGVDIDPERVREAKENVRSAGVQDRAKIVQGDLFEMDLSDATVVALYLLPDLNLRLRPTLLKLKPGTRIVSHAFDMGDWAPDQVKHVDGKTVYLWTVPANGKMKVQARTGR